MIDKSLISKREETLEKAKEHLKKEFVGIDSIIDKFIESIRIWYLLPEIQTRPLIINLWGITGVGKTDLVRKFISFIDYSDKFCEIQMDSKDGNDTIQDYLETVFEDGDTHGILLLDEIQRFRSVNEEGKETNSKKFQDLWMLLSDGSFQSNSKIKNDLIRMIISEDYYADLADSSDSDEEKPQKKKKERKYKTFYWDAIRLKKLLKIEQSLTDIMQWDADTKIAKIKEKLSSKEVFEGTKYKKLLIIISGNLDEAFRMSSDVSDSDNDADVYHEYSKTINIVQIKRALTSRFKPEQIARFGNIHLIYPILNREGYMNIIKQKIGILISSIKEKHNIVISVDDSIYEVIYKNGVFPTQGVRPLISTISSIFENAVPTFLFEYIKNGAKEEIKLTYEDKNILSTIKGKVIKHKVPTVLEDIRNKNSKNRLIQTSVHEAGHAVMYSLLFKTVPTQIVSNTTDSYSLGFIGIHNTMNTKKQYENQIKILFAGKIAEELVFGSENTSTGCIGDYAIAYSHAAKMIRRTGMGDTNTYVVSPISHQTSEFSENVNRFDDSIEQLLNDLYKKSKRILKKNKQFLLTVSDALIQKSKIEPEDFKNLAKPFAGEIEILSAEKSIETDFKELYNSFKTNETTYKR